MDSWDNPSGVAPNNSQVVSYGTAQAVAAQPWHTQISLQGRLNFFIIIPSYRDVNCFGPDGVTCHLLSERRSCRVKLGWHGLFGV